MARMTCPTYSSQLEIDLAAIRSNYRAIAGRVAPAECASVVKADAYGLGVAKVAEALHHEGCRTFFVAHLGEAFALFDAIGSGSVIYILNGLDPGCEALCAQWSFVPVLNSLSQIDRWRDLARKLGRPLSAALQLDTGMSRLGLGLRQAAELAQDPRLREDISLRLVMSHLACADEPHRAANARQLAQLDAGLPLFPGVPASIANSGGAYLGADYSRDVARAGVALFGVDPGAGATDLRPVVRLDARILQIRDVDQGTGVGYGLDYIAPGARRLATIGIGYADGWPRHLGNVGAAWHQGHRLPIVGRVSMDSLTIDISDVPAGALDEGAFVELIGPSQSLSDVARDAGTIPYEVLTRLGRRHQRVYVDGSRTEIVAPGEMQ